MSEKVEKVKKRKRTTEGSSKPIKRVAIEKVKQVQVTVSEVGKWAPIIASTPGLAAPAAVHLKPYTKARCNPATRSGLSGRIATEELLLHSSEHPKFDYTAIEEEAGGKDAPLKHYVGIYDPETGKMEVVEARKMVVRSSVRAEQATVEDHEISRSMDKTENRNNLGQTFGTKKARKAIAANTENAISPDKSARSKDNKPAKINAATAAILASMADGANSMTSREELAQQVEDSKPRPKANKEAQAVEDVYTVDSLIGKDVFGAVPVRTWQADIKANKEIECPSRYVASRIMKVSAHVEKLRILRYMVLMLEVLNSCRINRGQRTLPKRDELKKLLGDIPEAVLEGMKRKFAQGDLITKFGADLMITHMCALACIVDGYEVDMFKLQEDLKLETKEMSQYFREIGAKVGALGEVERKKQGLDKAAASQRKVAKLRLPLEFPKVSSGRRL
ncbi:uncharacterized protein L3040_003899 [Drepanopeziza brunnea f. sp. 'multigermtubi']|uniref:A49-like RNA polymerase I associated factor n=1 Tax=Marssonina brunnea f. sp. multigermtubi (strain MB_m1) TaxID=1072389 RepID=K1XQK2_MARBU|nr:A49-like RNA polymerase I associated factor [Drepanopeziza brunnea f. sp. 'multigermtubi' MB_m1]EKD14884.1 A49-like RNA polymerase I associated factor [Drepanopeziza brunnea f. sp. 'multigermtubi' MB_m1]KAJ5046665.1 hypothetical protein L3040_003899 [Drepanopeziza brunnea f. sp. 'multigermtubi']